MKPPLAVNALIGKVPKRLVRDELETRGLLDFIRAPGAQA